MQSELYNRRIMLGFALSALLILVAFFAAWRIGQSARQLGELTIHTAIVLGKSEQVVRNAIDAEVGVRRYIYTVHSSEYLDLFNKSKIELKNNILELNNLTQDNKIQQKKISILNTEISTIMMGLEAIIAVSHSESLERAKHLIELDTDKAVMDQLRQDIKDIQAIERGLFHERRQKFSQAYRSQTIFSFSAMGGAILLAAGTMLVMHRQLQDLQKAREALSLLNQSLEQKVETRTVELITLAAALEQKRAEAVFEKSRIELLLRELNHRIGNNLATASAFLGLEAGNTKNVEAKRIIESARSRILGIASAQRRLRLEDDMISINAKATLTAVVDDLLNTSSYPSDVELKIDVESLSLESRDITSLAIIINELVTNALQHAFIDRHANNLSIKLERSSLGLKLVVNDNGIGFDTGTFNQKKVGLGHAIINRIAQQYGGNVVWASNSESGTSVHIHFPKMAIKDNINEIQGEMEPLRT
jgi:two-component sensor histidine kinase/CHASE3 domain sensor protein